MPLDDMQEAFFKAGFDVAKDFCESIAKFTYDKAKDKAGEMAVELNLGFRDYLILHIERFSKVKTLVNRHLPADFLSIYVDSTIKIGRHEVGEADVAKYLLSNRLMILTGTAGCGKSMLIRRLFLRFLETRRGYIPLFVTLRDIKSGQKLYDFLLDELRRPASHLSSSQYEHGMKIGKFLLLLDGLDEVPHGERAKISTQIIELSRSYPKILIVCTSRPDEAFIAWGEFTVGSVMPLAPDQVENLVKKAPYDDEAKTKFLKIVKTELLESHSAFLSNPLLCMMMLLTYDEQKEIPGKMSSFYSLAFDVLYGTHDRSKGHGFKRQFYAAIEPDDFRNVFCTFCTMLYMSNKVAATLDEARDFARTSLDLHNVDAEPSAFLEDLSKSVCIMVQDGLYFSFIHRSFQEYFVAAFIIERYNSSVYAIADMALNKGDEVIGLLADMNKEAFERKYFRQKLTSVIETFDRYMKASSYALAFKMFYLGLHMDPNDKEDKMSFLVSSGMKQAEFLLFYETAAALYEIDDGWPIKEFDWKAWAIKNGLPNGIGAFEDNLTDQILEETPVVDVLNAMLTSFKNVREEIQKRESEHDKVFSGFLPTSYS